MSERWSELARRLRAPEHADRFRFYGGALPEEIDATEGALGAPLPPSFRWFLQEFGGAQLDSEVFGVAGTAGRDMVRENRAVHRSERPLPRYLLAFARNRYRTLCCFDVRREIDGEYPITYRDPGGGENATEAIFPDWLEKELYWNELGPRPPREWANDDGWERFWQRVANDEGELGPGDGGLVGSPLRGRLEYLRERGMRRLLFPGNGFSPVPHCLAHCGFECVALDVSPTASAYVERHAVPEEELALFFSDPEEPELEAARRRAEQEFRPGGRVVVVTESMFTHEPEELYDAIYSRRAFHGFGPEDQVRLARLHYRWLAPGGLCLVETQGLGGEAQQQVERVFRKAGFVIEDEQRPTGHGYDVKVAAFEHCLT